MFGKFKSSGRIFRDLRTEIEKLFMFLIVEKFFNLLIIILNAFGISFLEFVMFKWIWVILINHGLHDFKVLQGLG